MKEALLYERLSEGRVRCNLCAHRCLIADGRTGTCGVRLNRGGALYTAAYGRTVTQHVDPIEKKPLLHFYPGSTAYSIATAGCNFHCRWCQNWSISQAAPKNGLLPGSAAAPEQMVAAAVKAGCRSIAYTYTEPTVFFEYACETARLARAAGLANLYVTNGYMTSEMLDGIQPYLDAANVDLKAFREETYRRYVGARLQPVLDSLKRIRQLGIWLEVTTLLIPGINDDRAELTDAAQFVAQELGVHTPWHISRFMPAYKMMNVPPTPLESIREAKQIGLDSGLRYVYCGNTGQGVDTHCHSCGHLLIQRSGFGVESNALDTDGRCPRCSAEIPGIGMSPSRTRDGRAEPGAR